jgi:tetratricopeptide (TPR) repeat protein
MAIKSIKLNNIALRLALLAAALLCVFAVYSSVKWLLANTLTATQYKDIAEISVDLSPNDPETHYNLAVLQEQTFLPEDFAKSLGEYERAVSLSPHDFRLWFDLGKARDRNGDTAGAEKAFRKAVELAPHYSRNHWALGNLLLREGNTEEAFVEIRRAVENDASYGIPAVTTVWGVFNGDVALISQKIGDSTPIKAALSTFLARQQRFDEAFVLWNQLSADDKKITYKENSEQLLQALLTAQKFRDALSVQSQILQTEGEQFELGKIFNGGFEAEVKAVNPGIFEWKITDGQQPQIGFDDRQKHGGNRSLVIVFKSINGQDFRAIQQTVPVESGKRYNFEAFARSNLETDATLKWEITDTAGGKVLASTSPVPANSEWAPLKAEFTTTPTTQAVTIRLARVTCPTSLCPISGRIWFDDFNLKKSE